MASATKRQELSTDQHSIDSQISPTAFPQGIKHHGKVMQSSQLNLNPLRNRPKKGSFEDERLANGLGWFSIGMGLAQLITPGSINRLIGIKDTDDNSTIMRLIGARELAAGLGILTRHRPVGWLSARVGGDIMDLVLLGNAFNSKRNNQERLIVATVAVLGLTALDIYSAMANNLKTNLINNKVTIRRSMTINRPIEEVFNFWHNFENLAGFMSHLESVQVTGEGRSHWVAKAPAGMKVEWDAELVQDIPNRLISWRSVEGSEIITSGSVLFEEAPGKRGTEIKVELQYEPPAGLIGMTIAKLFGEEPEQQLQDDLPRFKQIMETGEVVRSDGSVHNVGQPLAGNVIGKTAGK